MRCVFAITPSTIYNHTRKKPHTVIMKNVFISRLFHFKCVGCTFLLISILTIYLRFDNYSEWTISIISSYSSCRILFIQLNLYLCNNPLPFPRTATFPCSFLASASIRCIFPLIVSCFFFGRTNRNSFRYSHFSAHILSSILIAKKNETAFHGVCLATKDPHQLEIISKHRKKK